MSIANINFTKTYTPPPINAVNLRLGVSDVVEVDPLSAVVLMSSPAPKLYATSVYNSRTSRPVEASPDMAWQRAGRNDEAVSGGWVMADKLRHPVAKPWQQAQPLSAGVAEHAQDMGRLNLSAVAVWQQATQLHTDPVDELFKALLKDDHLSVLPWQQAAHLATAAAAQFVQLLPANRLRELRWEDAQALARSMTQAYQKAKDGSRKLSIPWEIGRQPPSGREAPVQPPVQPPVYQPTADLNFLCKCTFPSPLAVLLNFGKHPCPGGTVVPERKVYFIVNTLSMKRVSDNTPIELVSASVGIDKNSWCWSFSGAVPYTEFEKVEPTATGPVEVELEINGLVWRLLIEKYNTKEVFAKTDISISGRSVTAWLDEPYAPVRSFVQTTTLTSRQFAEAELTRAGLVTGFTLDWQLVDALGWQMPAYTWSYTDLTPVQVIQAIAQGAGGYVNSHPSAKELIVRAEYPTPFWEWATATADRTIPESLILSRSLDWEERPVYNGVYVSGELTGVNDFVRRTGTTGAMQAPPFVGPMISDHAAARSKGIAILSASGKQARVGLELPMEPTLGLVTPGMLVQVQKDASNNWRGLVNSTQIGAVWGDNDSLTVSQSIELERHYGGL